MENAPLVPVAQNFAKIGPTENPNSKDDPIFWAKFKRVAGAEFFPRAAAVVAERVPRRRAVGRYSNYNTKLHKTEENYKSIITKYKYKIH